MEQQWKHDKPPQSNRGNCRQEFTLCLLPGFDGTEKLWDPFIARLPVEQNYTLITYPTAIPLTFQELIETAEAQIPVTSPVVLLALSFSGPILLQILERKNRNIIGAIFCATFATPPRPTLLRLTSLLPMGWLIRTLGMNMRWLIQALFFEAQTDRELVELLQSVIGELRSKVIDNRVRILTELGTQITPPNIDIPCCYLQAAKDKLVPASALAVFKQAVPKLKTYSVDAPHGLLQSHPDECLRIIQDFIASLAPTLHVKTP